jgi:uncharacterized protein YjbI with pentapeptide repeats
MYQRMRGPFRLGVPGGDFPLAAQNPPAGLRSANPRGVQERLSKTTGSEIPDLSGLDLRRLDLSWLDFRQANLMKARLDSANLSGAKLFAVDLTDATAIGADLSKANLDGSTLRRTNLQHANLRGRKPLCDDRGGRRPE